MTNAQDIKIYRDFFKGRLDDFAEQTEAGEYYRLGKPFEESCIAEHLEGHKSYGMYLIIPDSNLCWHTVIDIDVLEIEPVTFIIAALLKIGIKDTQILLEFSGSKGYHVWLTFDKAIDSWKTLKLGQAIVESSGIETKIEVFPKQDSVAKDKFGSLIKLPLGVHKKSGKRSCFLGTKFEPITDWCSHLTSIEKVSIEQLDSILLEVFKQEHFMVVKTQLDERMPIIRGKLPPCVNKISKSDILEGIRDNILYRLAIIFKKNSYLKEATLEMLQRLNKERCKPPLSETEVFKKVDSAYEGAYTGFGCEASYMQEFCDEACFLKKGNILNEDKDFGQPVVLKDFIDNFKDEKIESIWGDGIINYDSKTIISGMGKLGKSNFVMNLGLCIATGRDFLNIRVIKKSKVLYIQQEISSHALYARLKLMLESIGEVDKENFTICNVRGFDILNASHFSQLEKWIREKGYEVVMFDPLYKFHNKEENSTQAMKQVFDKFDELIDKYKISIIIVHHHGKGEKQGGHVLRGSSTIFDWGDSYIILKSSGDSIEVTWELRNAANPRPLKIKLNNNLYYECSAADKKESAINKIVDIVKASSQDGISQKDIVEKAKESIGVSDGTVRNFIKEAKKRKKIKTLDAKQKKGKGVYWSIT